MRRYLADAERVEEAHVLADYRLEVCPAQATHDTLTRPIEADRTRVYEDKFCDGKVDVVERKLISIGAKSCRRHGPIRETGKSSSKLTKDDLWPLSVVSFSWTRLCRTTDDQQRIRSSSCDSCDGTQNNDKVVPSCGIGP